VRTAAVMPDKIAAVIRLRWAMVASTVRDAKQRRATGKVPQGCGKGRG